MIRGNDEVGGRRAAGPKRCCDPRRRGELWAVWAPNRSNRRAPRESRASASGEMKKGELKGTCLVLCEGVAGVAKKNQPVRDSDCEVVREEDAAPPHTLTHRLNSTPSRAATHTERKAHLRKDKDGSLLVKRNLEIVAAPAICLFLCLCHHRW